MSIKVAKKPSTMGRGSVERVRSAPETLEYMSTLK